LKVKSDQDSDDDTQDSADGGYGKDRLMIFGMMKFTL